MGEPVASDCIKQHGDEVHMNLMTHGSIMTQESSNTGTNDATPPLTIGLTSTPCKLDGPGVCPSRVEVHSEHKLDHVLATLPCNNGPSSEVIHYLMWQSWCERRKNSV